jgi:hypothetical protein
LLPNTPEVHTVEEQLRLAAAKGQLPVSRTWVIERFEVSRGEDAVLEAESSARRADA